MLPWGPWGLMRNRKLLGLEGAAPRNLQTSVPQVLGAHSHPKAERFKMPEDAFQKGKKSRSGFFETLLKCVLIHF